MKTTFIVLRMKERGHRGTGRAPPRVANVSSEIIDDEGTQLSQLSRDPEVVSVAPAMPMNLIQPFAGSEAASDESEGASWGIRAVKADTSPFDGDGVAVAILDTGIDAKHEVFAGLKLIERDFTGSGDGDHNGHGTHCAGTICGREFRGKRIGIATGVSTALIGKVLDAAGRGTSEQLVRGILWAVEAGATVISMSLGIDFPGYVRQLIASGVPDEVATSRALEGYRASTRLFDTLVAHVGSRAPFGKAVLIVAAGGNESRRDLGASSYRLSVGPPAIADDVISVGAVQQDPGGLNVAAFSNMGVKVCAPGVDIVSAAPGGGLQYMSGTSMAAPHVAGVAALWAQKLQRSGRLRAFELVSRLVGSASHDNICAGFDPLDIGAGVIQAPQK